MRQNDKARNAVTDARISYHINVALLRFADFVNYHKRLHAADGECPVRIWGHGAAFDNALLRAAYTKTHITAPWHHRGDMCYRTMKNLHPEVAAGTNANEHNALSDAVQQARHLCAIFEHIRQGGAPHVNQ